MIFQEPFLRGVQSLVQKYKEDGLESVLENYMIWRVVATFYPNRPSEEYVRRETCLKLTEDVFSPVVTSMYIKSMGIDKSKMAVDQVTMMVQSMQEAFR